MKLGGLRRSRVDGKEVEKRRGEVGQTTLYACMKFSRSQEEDINKTNVY